MLALEVVMLGYAGGSVMAAMASMSPNPSARTITQTPANFGLSYQTVSFPSRDDHLLIRGWLMPGLLPDGRQTVQRTIIVVHGIPGNRGSVLSVSAALVRHGFAVLALDLRGDGESASAPLSLGEFEQRDILGAVDFLQTGALPFPLLGRPRAIGGWGMSLGASTLLLAAAAEPALRAIISDSAFADATAVVRSWWAQRGLSWLLPGGLLTARLLYGVNYAQARPVAVVAQIAPRPIWFIHGTADSTVPIANMDQLVAAASQPPNAHVQTWKVPGAQHVQAFSLMQEAYVQRMVAFYQSALGPDSQ
jgi:dipeptidyl aminopeptidase/acylaminoacyl peptidase